MNRTLTIPAKIENLDDVLFFVENVTGDCPAEFQTKLGIVVEEIFVNIAHYAYGEESGNAVITVCGDDREITITFKDEGVPYNPLEKSDPNITLSAEERDIGGLGIFMVKQMTDKVSYIHKDGKNILTIFKKKPV